MRHQNLMNQIKQFNKVLGKVIKAIREAKAKTVLAITYRSLTQIAVSDRVLRVTWGI